jgi:RNA polymerase-binding transcription factor DksA
MANNLKRIQDSLVVERKRLLDEQKQLQSTGLSSGERREGSPYGKRDEEATENFELGKRLALERQIEDQLADTENALAKIAACKYGSCESCGKPIEAARLQALPQARTCMNCKGHHKGFVNGSILIT